MKWKMIEGFRICVSRSVAKYGYLTQKIRFSLSINFFYFLYFLFFFLKSISDENFVECRD